jgi:DNA-binding beta-propeller fold protein YncE
MISPSHVPLLGLLALGLLAAMARADEPKYPKVNVATAYTVDPHWPQKPADAFWGEMPGVAVDAHDHVYIFTRAQPPVQVYDADGNFLGAWGRDTLKTAHHLKIDHEGNVWAADIGHHVVRQFTPDGKLLRTIGTVDHPGKDDSHLNMPTDMAVTPDGDVFVADGYGNARVVHFDKQGRFVKEWGELGSKPGQFSIPHAIAIDSKGRLYVADRNNVRIQVFDPKGNLLDVWDNVVTPWGFCMTKDDELWVCGSSPMQWRPEDTALGCPPKDQVIVRFNTAGKLLQLWTVPKGLDGLERPGELNWVHGIAVDSKGNLYAGDILGKRAQKFVRQLP